MVEQFVCVGLSLAMVATFFVALIGGIFWVVGKFVEW